MPNDAKLGMVLGVALVIVAAIFFVPKDGSSSSALKTASALQRSHSGPHRPRPSASRDTLPGASEKNEEGASFTVAAPKKPAEQESDQGR